MRGSLCCLPPLRAPLLSPLGATVPGDSSHLPDPQAGRGTPGTTAGGWQGAARTPCCTQEKGGSEIGLCSSTPLHASPCVCSGLMPHPQKETTAAPHPIMATQPEWLGYVWETPKWFWRGPLGQWRLRGEVKGSVYQWEHVSVCRHSGTEQAVCRHCGAKLMLRTEPCCWNRASSSIAHCYHRFPAKLGCPKLQATVTGSTGDKAHLCCEHKHHQFVAYRVASLDNHLFHLGNRHYFLPY